jgi:Transglycosylase SLT domain
MQVMDRRQFIKTAAWASAALAISRFMPDIAKAAAPLAEAHLPSRHFRESTLVLARKHLVKNGVDERYAVELLDDPRAGPLAYGQSGIRAENINNISYGRYKEFFRFDMLLEKGVAFHGEHATWLLESEMKSGAPGALTAATLGIETIYGTFLGRYVALNAYLTELEKRLAIPNPGDNIRKEIDWELAQMPGLLSIANHFGKDPFEIMGSRKGAITAGQFMPTTLLPQIKLDDYKSYEELASVKTAISLTSAKLASDGATRNAKLVPDLSNPNYNASKSYNPKEKHYPRFVVELGAAISEKAGAWMDAIEPVQPRPLEHTDFAPKILEPLPYPLPKFRWPKIKM